MASRSLSAVRPGVLEFCESLVQFLVRYAPLCGELEVAAALGVHPKEIGCSVVR